MLLENTTGAQDREIQAAEQSQHVRNLVAIIEELDAKVTQWRKAAESFGCKDPGDLESWYDEYSKNEGAST